MTIHGESLHKEPSPEYRAWCNMKTRCSNPNRHRSHRYVGRGISVCDRWLNSFENFLADKGRRPSPEHSFDRIDNDGDYTPENTQWATVAEQQANRSNNIRVELHGETVILAEACRQLGIHMPRIDKYVSRKGWSHQQAIDHFAKIRLT
jgi:hypothetical protein